MTRSRTVGVVFVLAGTLLVPALWGDSPESLQRGLAGLQHQLEALTREYRCELDRLVLRIGDMETRLQELQFENEALRLEVAILRDRLGPAPATDIAAPAREPISPGRVFTVLAESRAAAFVAGLAAKVGEEIRGSREAWEELTRRVEAAAEETIRTAETTAMEPEPLVETACDPAGSEEHLVAVEPPEDSPVPETAVPPESQADVLAEDSSASLELSDYQLEPEAFFGSEFWELPKLPVEGGVSDVMEDPAASVEPETENAPLVDHDLDVSIDDAPAEEFPVPPEPPFYQESMGSEDDLPASEFPVPLYDEPAGAVDAGEYRYFGGSPDAQEAFPLPSEQ